MKLIDKVFQIKKLYSKIRYDLMVFMAFFLVQNQVTYAHDLQTPAVRIAEFTCSDDPFQTCGPSNIDIRSQSFYGPLAECFLTTPHLFPYYVTSITVPPGQMGWTSYDANDVACYNQSQNKPITFQLTCVSSSDILKETCECKCP